MSKLLLIDDDQANLYLMNGIAKKHLPDSIVFMAQNPLDGLKIARTEFPDTIVLDLNMPLMNGYEVCLKLKGDPITRHIPVIICTSESHNSETTIRSLESGADAFVNRPVNGEELAAQIKAMLRIKRAEDGLKREMDKYKAMTETLPYAITTVNLNGEILFVSNQSLEIFGYQKAGELIHTKLTDLIIPEHQNLGKNILKRALKEGVIRAMELKFVRKDGTEFIGEMSAAVIRTVTGEISEIIVLTKDITDRKETENAILSYQKKFKEINMEMSKVEEIERRKIASNLHDGLGQTLSIVHFKLSSMLNQSSTPKAEKMLRESTELIHSAIKESRLITYDLSPPILFELGLIAALEWRLDQIKERFEVDTEFTCGERDLKFDHDSSILLYRSICELLMNVIKHAKATHIQIEVKHEEAQVVFQIIDNGVGIHKTSRTPPLARKGGLGLFSIRERLDSINGVLHLESGQQSGTKASVIVPYFNQPTHAN